MQPQERTHTPGMLALALAPGTLLAGVAGGIAFPILPITGVRLGLSLPFIGVILAANRATRVVFSPTVGVLADRFGGRRTMLAGMVMQIVVMSLYVLGIVTRRAGEFFLAGRLLHGAGSGCVFIAAQALALHAGGTEHAGRAAGTVRAAIVLGIPLGLPIGGLLADWVGDAAAFGIAGLAMVVALIAAYVTVPDLRTHVSTRPPLRQMAGELRDSRLLSVGVINLVLNFAVGGLVLTTLALLVEQRHLSLLGTTGRSTAGLLMGLMMVADAAMTPLAGRLGDRRHAHAWVTGAGLLLLVPGLVLVGLSPGSGGVAAGLLLMGVGSAGLGPSLLVLLGRVVSQERRGAAAGVLQFSGDIGGMLGPLVGTLMLGAGTALPYLASAVLVLLTLPFVRPLIRLEAR
jgi:ACDE family multidrug resistance protein